MDMPAHRRDRRIIASASFGVFQRLVQVACTLMLMPIVLRALGLVQFGVWGAAASLAWMSALVDIGTGSALVTLVAGSLARDQESEARNHITGALTIGSCLSGFLLLLASVAWIGGVLHGGAAPYVIAFVGLALNVPLNSANNVWMALQKGYVSGFWELVQTVVTTSSLVCAAAFTDDVRVFVALVYAGLVLANLGSLIHLLLRHPELRPRGLPESREAIRKVAGSGIMFFALSIAAGLSFLLDNVIALQLLGPEASARMTIALRVCITAVGVLAVISQPLWPAFADAANSSDRRWIRRSLIRATALLAGATAIGSTILLLYGEPLLRLWLHTDIGIGKTLPWAIAAWVLMESLIRVPCMLLYGLSLVRFQTIVFAAATSVALALKFALAPVFGVAGILWGTSITALLIIFPASVWRIYRWADDSSKREKNVLEDLGAAVRNLP